MTTKVSGTLANTFIFFPLLVSLSFILIDVDGRIVSNQRLSYLPLVLILFYFLTQNASIFRFHNFAHLAIISSLAIYGLGFAVLGKLTSDNPGSFLSLFLPIIILFFSSESFFQINLRLIAKVITIGVTVLQALTIMRLNSFLPYNSILNFSFEKVYLVILGLLLAFFYKFKLLFCMNLFLYIWNFNLYSAASYFLPIFAVVLFFFLYVICQWKRAFILFNLIFLSQAAIGIYLLQYGQAILDQLFRLTQKQNNTFFRNYLNQRSLEQISERPFIGTLFKGDATKARIGNADIVSHNDFINMLLAGGFLLVLFFSMFISLILVTSIRHIRSFPELNDNSRMLIALNVSLLTFLALSNFLALLSKPSNSIIFFSLVFAVSSLSKKFNFKSTESARPT
jgi:hypothetical protein